MSQESKQIFPTTQQIKLRQLELEVETLERQIENILGIEPESSPDQPEIAPYLQSKDNIKSLSDLTPVYLIHAQKTSKRKHTVIKLTSDRPG